MITVEEAERLVLDTMPRMPAVCRPLAEVRGGVLHEPITADRPFPPYHRVAMDGIALAYATWERGARSFPVAGTQAAGQPQTALPDPGHCVEVMTGAVLPEGADCVVPVEELVLDNGTATIREDFELKPMHNVHVQGEDREEGAVLLGEGSILFGPQCAIAATVGKAELLVSEQPAVAIVSTGDELIEVKGIPLPHQIRASNSHAMKASLEVAGFRDVRLSHLPDDEDATVSGLGTVLESCQVVVICGGVSAGRYDYVPTALERLGVKQLFHKVSQRPGKPMWFGAGPDGQAVFGLPGNPVSSLVCLHRYVLAGLWASLGARLVDVDERPGARLGAEFAFKKSLTYFLPVTLRETADGMRTACAVAMGGSGDLAGLADSDGFLELPAEPKVFEAGSVYPLWTWAAPYGHAALR